MERRESRDGIKERIARLREETQKLSRRISRNLPSAPVLTVAVETRKEAEPGESEERQAFLPREGDKILRNEQLEQELQYVNMKLANFEHERDSLQRKIGELVGNNERLLGKCGELEQLKNSGQIKIEELEKRLADAEKKAGLAYVLEMIKEFISEFLRHSRDVLGVMGESIQMSIASEGVPGDVKDRMRLVEENIKYLYDLLSESVKKYHFDAPKPNMVDLSKYVRGIIDNVIASRQFQGITISTKFPEKPVIVSADTKLLGEAVENLVLNAAESMIKGGQLDVSCELADNRAVLVIADSGLGIPAHLLDKIYRPFFSNKKGHYGLGLTRTYWIMKILGYNMQIESVVNRGTKVRIVFP